MKLVFAPGLLHVSRTRPATWPVLQRDVMDVTI